MSSGRGARKALLTTHLIFSLGWIGAALAYLALAITVGSSGDPGSVRGAWSAMELTGWVVIVPLAPGVPRHGPGRYDQELWMRDLILGAAYLPR